MSWSATLEVNVKQGYEAVMDVTYRQLQNGHGAVESAMACDKASIAVRKLLETQVYGEGKFRVNLTGHSNPDNKPGAGWANDFLSISINQVL